MGQAKQRGTREERVQQALAKRMDDDQQLAMRIDARQHRAKALAAAFTKDEGKQHLAKLDRRQLQELGALLAARSLGATVQVVEESPPQ